MDAERNVNTSFYTGNFTHGWSARVQLDCRRHAGNTQRATFLKGVIQIASHQEHELKVEVNSFENPKGKYCVLSLIINFVNATQLLCCFCAFIQFWFKVNNSDNGFAPYVCCYVSWLWNVSLTWSIHNT